MSGNKGSDVLITGNEGGGRVEVTLVLLCLSRKAQAWSGRRKQPGVPSISLLFPLPPSTWSQSLQAGVELRSQVCWVELRAAGERRGGSSLAARREGTFW